MLQSNNIRLQHLLPGLLYTRDSVPDSTDMQWYSPVLHSPCGVGRGIVEDVEVSLGLYVEDGLQSPILEVVDGWLELDVVEGRIVHEVVGGPDVTVLVLLTARHCCELQVPPVFTSTGADKSDGSPVDMPVFTSTL